MKSKKARQLLDSKSFIEDDEMPIYSIDYDYAEQAVELAEAEMRELAIKAHRKLCPFYAGGICDGLKPCSDECIYMFGLIVVLQDTKTTK